MNPPPTLLTLPLASGEKAKARDILAAIRTLQRIEQEQRPATPDERQALARFAGFGPVALSIFPDPVTGRYKDAAWQALGEELRALLSPEEYASAKRTTFTAFYTSPLVIRPCTGPSPASACPRMRPCWSRAAAPATSWAWRPPACASSASSWIPSPAASPGRCYPDHDIRIENFRDTRLPEGRIDAVIGNVPFADVKLDYTGSSLSLHDFFFAKSLDALKPGGVLALVTSHYTLDKQNAAVREYLAAAGRFPGGHPPALRRLQARGHARRHRHRVPAQAGAGRAGPATPTPTGWRPRRSPSRASTIPINRYFLHHPEMVLGTWSRKDRLYGGEATASSATATSPSSSAPPSSRLPEGVYTGSRHAAPDAPAPRLHARRRPGAPHHRGQLLRRRRPDHPARSSGGEAVPVTYGGTPLQGRRHDDRASGWPPSSACATTPAASCSRRTRAGPRRTAQEARRELNRAYDRFVAAYGPINKTTFPRPPTAPSSAACPTW